MITGEPPASAPGAGPEAPPPAVTVTLGPPSTPGATVARRAASGPAASPAGRQGRRRSPLGRRARPRILGRHPRRRRPRRRRRDARKRVQRRSLRARRRGPISTAHRPGPRGAAGAAASLSRARRARSTRSSCSDAWKSCARRATAQAIAWYDEYLAQAPDGRLRGGGAGTEDDPHRRARRPIGGAAHRGRISSSLPGRQLCRIGARAPARPVADAVHAGGHARPPLRVARGSARAGGDDRHRPAGGRFARADRDGLAAPRRAAVARARRRVRRAAPPVRTRARRTRVPGCNRSRPRATPTRSSRSAPTLGAATVDIYVLDRRTRRSEVSRVALESSAEDGPARLAIRTIEVLRSHLVEIDLAARASPAGPIDVRAAPRRRPRRGAPAAAADRVGLEAGAAVLTGVDGVGPALLPTVRVGWATRSGLVLHAALAGLGSRPTLTAPAGSARVAQQFGLLGICTGAPSMQRAPALYVGARGRRVANRDRRRGRRARGGACRRSLVLPASTEASARVSACRAGPSSRWRCTCRSRRRTSRFTSPTRSSRRPGVRTCCSPSPSVPGCDARALAPRASSWRASSWLDLVGAGSGCARADLYPVTSATRRVADGGGAPTASRP